MLSVNPIHVGAIYIEQDIGTDATGDSFIISFHGGASSTQLDRVTISGDQAIVGFGIGDVFFDIADTGLGADGAFDFVVTSQSGIDQVSATVGDGGLELVLEFVGFDAGEHLGFSIDVDEVEDFDPSQTDVEYINEGIDPITSGVEFQGSQFTAEFSAAHFYDVSQTAEFRNKYDEALLASGLDLPTDNHDDNRDRTAGAFAQLDQQFIPAAISGHVFHDRNDNGIREAGEEGIANVQLEVIPITTVADVAPVVVFSDSAGFYQTTGLAAGQYRIVETVQPAGYLDGIDAAGTVAGALVGMAHNPGDEITDIVLAGGQTGIDYDFGEVLPASIAGRVQLSTPEGDCFGEDIFHEPVVGATVQLYDSNGLLVAETISDGNGQYEFTGLRPDTYTVVELTPEQLFDGGANPGTVDGLMIGRVNDEGSVTLDLTGGQAVEQVDFCEHAPASLTGYVYHDRNNNGRREPGEEGIPNVVVQLVDQDGAIVAEAKTNQLGSYAFLRLEAGIYQLRQLHPADWIDGLDTVGWIGGVPSGTADNPGDLIRDVQIGWGDEGTEFNFGELLPGTISGRVQLSNEEGDCFGDSATHEGLAGVRVWLINELGETVAETRTDENGSYEFTGLLPGTYSIVEETPDQLFDGGARAGHTDGAANGRAIDGDHITGIKLDSGQSSLDNLFCEHRPASLTGKVYHDRNDNGVRETGEEGIAGVVIQLLDQQGNIVAETVTDKDGCYQFTGIPAGKYDIRQIQPGGWLDGTDSAGQVDGQPSGQPENPGDVIRCVELNWGDEGQEFNFAELLPGVIAGFVHTDLVRDCVFRPEANETGIPGVTVQLLSAEGQVIATTKTNAWGRYRFEGLRPGVYSVRELQPAAYFDGGHHDGQQKGDGDLIAGVPLGSGQSITSLNFCEVPPGFIAGYVFQDGDVVTLQNDEALPERLADVRDGQRSADDTPLAGVVVQLRDGLTGRGVEASIALDGYYAPGFISALTDEDGYYEFRGLPPGSYSVYQVQPTDYIDGVDTPGTTSGFVFNPGEPVSNVVLQSLQVDPQNNAIVRISLPPGSRSIENNFSEILVEIEEPRILYVPQIPLGELPEILPQPYQVTPPIYTVPALPEFVLQPFGDGSESPVSDWHLSIIDGGHPRGRGFNVPDGDNIWMAANKRRRHDLALRDGAWRLPRTYAHAEPGEPVHFGLAGAIPVAADFNGDGFDEIGFFRRGEWFIDINANGEWDAEDLWARLGDKDDVPVTGDWDGDGKADIGVFGRAWAGDARALAHEPGLPDAENTAPAQRSRNMPPTPQQATSRQRLMQLAAQGRVRADLIDHVFHFGGPADAPVVGDWNGDGITSIGIFRDGKWHVDANGDGKWTEADRVFQFGQPGDIPLAGDFNGDGIDDIGVYRDGWVKVDANGNRRWDEHDLRQRVGRPGEFPVVGDFDGNGQDEVATYRGIREDAAAAEGVSDDAPTRTALRDAG